MKIIDVFPLSSAQAADDQAFVVVAIIQDAALAACRRMSIRCVLIFAA